MTQEMWERPRHCSQSGRHKRGRRHTVSMPVSTPVSTAVPRGQRISGARGMWGTGGELEMLPLLQKTAWQLL